MTLISELRCKACDDVLTDDEAMQINQTTGEHEDLCTDCLDVINHVLYDEYVDMMSKNTQ